MRRVFSVVVLCAALLMIVSAVWADAAKEKVALHRFSITDLPLARGPIVTYPPVDEQWDLVFYFDGTTPTADDQLLGCEFAGGQFFITGGGGTAGVQENTVWIFDDEGTFVTSFLQWSSAGWGWRDLAYDGTYLYGSDDSVIDAFDLQGTSVPGSNINGPGNPNRALAYDPDLDHFWTQDFSGPLYEFTRTGSIVWSGTNAATAYGAAWDDADPDGPWLWIFSQTGTPQTTIHQFNPTTHTPTGFVYQFPLIPGSSDQIAGGLAMTNEWDPSIWTLVGVTQGTPNDMIFCIEMYPSASLSAPGAPTNFVVEDNGATLMASLSWNNPTVTVGGDPLTDIDSVVVKRDTLIIATFTTVDTGQYMEYDDNTMTVAGMYDYMVYAVNDSGDGIPATGSAWIGPDVPGPVDNLVMTPGINYAMEATLTWVNPTSGFHGGYFTGCTGYHIERSDGAMFELVGEDTTYFDNTVPLPDYYYYTVTPYNESGDGFPQESNTAYIGMPQIYTWEEIPFVWNDIIPVGTNTGITSDDQNVGPFALGFDVEFFGNFFNSIRVCSNGWLSFTSTATTYSNVAIPNTAEPNNLVAPFWDDLYPPSGGQVYYYADAPNHTFTVQYNQVPHIGGQGPYSFQAVIHMDGSIDFFYLTNFAYNTDCTVGVENADGTEGCQVCYNGSGDFLPTNNSAIKILPPVTGFGAVQGTITLDGQLGDITQVIVEDIGGFQTHPTLNGDYFLDSARAGTNTITASYDQYFYPNDTTLTVEINDTTWDVDITIRRLEPSTPTGLDAVVDTSNGQVTLTWDAHPDPTVDIFALQRQRAGMQWEALAIVPAAVQTYNDQLPSEGQFFYRISASDLNVIPPASQSDWSDPVEVIWGELPPGNLEYDGYYDDQIELTWEAPGGGGPGPGGDILVVDDDGSPNNGGTYQAVESHFFDALDDAGLDYDTFIVDWTITSPPQNGPTLAEMSDYDVVIWFCGETWGYYGIDVLTAADETNLEDFMDGGGNLFLSAQDYLYASYPSAGSFSPGQFPYDYLGVTSVQQDYFAPPASCAGVTGSFAEGMSFSCAVPYPSATLWCDWIQTSDTELLIADATGASACQYQGTGFRSAFTTLSFEGLVDGTPPSTKAQLIENCVDWLLDSDGPSVVSAPPRESAPVPRAQNPIARGHVEVARGANKMEGFVELPMVQIQRLASIKTGLIKSTPDRSAVSFGTDETDQVVEYYKIYRDAVYLDTSYTEQYFDTGVPENEEYDYYVTAMYDNGQESGASNTVSAMCNMPPGRPTNFIGAPNTPETGMILTWDDPVVNADGSPCVDLDGLTIYRNGVFVADVNEGVETYEDIVPNPTMLYTWTIEAWDEVPNVGEQASFSGTVQSPWNPIPYFWHDISAVGTPLTIGDDQNLGPFNLGFTMYFYGNTFSSIRICSNGFLSYTSTSSTLSNTYIPNPSEPNNLIAAFWDDLNPAAGGQVYYHSEPAVGWFTVQFQDIPHYSTGGQNTFQWIVTEEGAVYLNYNYLSPPLNEATAGVENAGGTEGIELNYNGVGPFQLANQTSVAFWAGPPAQGNLEGYVLEAEGNDPIENAMVVCGIDTGYTDATGYYEVINILAGNYEATASAFGYNSESDSVEIFADSTVTLDFLLHQPIIDIDVSSIEVAMYAGEVRDTTFNISNLGDGTLEFEIDVEVTGAVFDRASPARIVVKPTSPDNTATASMHRALKANNDLLDHYYAPLYQTDSDLAPFTGPCRPATPAPFNVDQIVWVVGTSMPTSRYSGATGTYNGEIFVSHGRISDSAPYNTNIVEAYDYMDDSWRTDLTAGPTARRMVAGGVMYEDEYLYVVGGRAEPSTTVGTLEIYDMSNDTWTTGPSCNARWAHGGAVLDGYVYVFGSSGSPAPNTSAQRYSIASGTWEDLPSMPNGAGWLSGAAAAGKVYAIGGSTTETVMREYDPATNSWSLKTPVPHGRIYARSVGINDLVYVAGGDQAGNIVDVYDPETDTWTTETNTPSIITWQQMGISPFAIYIIGGTPQSSPVQYQNQVWIGEVGEPQEPWLTVFPEEATVEPGESQLITVTMTIPDTAQIGDVFTADLIVENNTITPEIIIPVEATVVSVVSDDEQVLPLEYALYQNYPNPFNPVTRIRFDLRQHSHVTLEIYNILGQKVVTLIDRSMDAGRHTATFDASKLASGLYFYRINANDFTDLKKMVLIK